MLDSTTTTSTIIVDAQEARKSFEQIKQFVTSTTMPNNNNNNNSAVVDVSFLERRLLTHCVNVFQHCNRFIISDDDDSSGCIFPRNTLYDASLKMVDNVLRKLFQFYSSSSSSSSCKNTTQQQQTTKNDDKENQVQTFLVSSKKENLKIQKEKEQQQQQETSSAAVRVAAFYSSFLACGPFRNTRNEKLQNNNNKSTTAQGDSCCVLSFHEKIFESDSTNNKTTMNNKNIVQEEELVATIYLLQMSISTLSKAILSSFSSSSSSSSCSYLLSQLDWSVTKCVVLVRKFHHHLLCGNDGNNDAATTNNNMNVNSQNHNRFFLQHCRSITVSLLSLLSSQYFSVVVSSSSSNTTKNLESQKFEILCQLHQISKEWFSMKNVNLFSSSSSSSSNNNSNNSEEQQQKQQQQHQIQLVRAVWNTTWLALQNDWNNCKENIQERKTEVESCENVARNIILNNNNNTRSGSERRRNEFKEAIQIVSNYESSSDKNNSNSNNSNSSLFPECWIDILKQQQQVTTEGKEEKKRFSLTLSALNILVNFLKQICVPLQQQQQHQTRSNSSAIDFLINCVFSSTALSTISSFPEIQKMFQALTPTFEMIAGSCLSFNKQKQKSVQEQQKDEIANETAQIFLLCKSLSICNAALNYNISSEVSLVMSLLNGCRFVFDEYYYSSNSNSNRCCDDDNFFLLSLVKNNLPARVKSYCNNVVDKVLDFSTTGNASDDDGQIKEIYQCLGTLELSLSLQLVTYLLCSQNEKNENFKKQQQQQYEISKPSTENQIAMCCRKVLMRCISFQNNNSNNNNNDQQQYKNYFANNNNKIQSVSSSSSSSSSTTTNYQQQQIPSDLHSMINVISCCKFLIHSYLYSSGGDIFSAKEFLTIPLLIALNAKKKILFQLSLEVFEFFQTQTFFRCETNFSNNNININTIKTPFDERSEWGSQHIGRNNNNNSSNSTSSLSYSSSSSISSSNIPQGIAIVEIKLLSSDSDFLEVIRYEPFISSCCNNDKNNNNNTNSTTTTTTTQQTLRKHKFIIPKIGSLVLNWFHENFQPLLKKAAKHGNGEEIQEDGENDENGNDVQDAASLLSNVQHNARRDTKIIEQQKVEEEEEQIIMDEQKKKKKLLVSKWWQTRRELDNKAKHLVIDELSNDILLSVSVLLTCRRTTTTTPCRKQQEQEQEQQLCECLESLSKMTKTSSSSSSSSSQKTKFKEEISFVTSLIYESLPALVKSARNTFLKKATSSTSQNNNNNSQQQNSYDSNSVSQLLIFSSQSQSQSQFNDPNNNNNNNNSNIDNIVIGEVASRIFHEIILPLLLVSSGNPQNATTDNRCDDDPSSSKFSEVFESFVSICQSWYFSAIHDNNNKNSNSDSNNNSEICEKLILVLDPKLRNIPWEKISVFDSVVVEQEVEKEIEVEIEEEEEEQQKDGDVSLFEEELNSILFDNSDFLDFSPPTLNSSSIQQQNNNNNTNENKKKQIKKTTTVVESKKTTLKDVSVVYRAPSLKFIFDSYTNNMSKSNISSSSSSLKKVGGVFCVVNPDGDMRNRCLDVYRKLMKNGCWKGILGGSNSISSSSSDSDSAATTTTTNSLYAENSDVLLYVGHNGPEVGANSLFPHRDMMRTIDEGASNFPVVPFKAVLALGCSSAKTSAYSSCSNHHQGGDFFSSSNSWLLAGCSTHVGLLWEVTDYEIDRIAKRALSVFYDLRSSSNSKNFENENCDQSTASSNETKILQEIEKQQQQQKNHNNNENHNNNNNNIVFRPDLPESFLRAASIACKLPFLSGAALICYGVPGILSKP